MIEELDKWTSIYCRVRFADEHTGMVHCYTCPARFHWSQMDAGHWQRRGHWAIRFDRDNIRPQCVHCNRVLNGLPDVFEEELRAEIGDEGVEALLSQKQAFGDMSDDWCSEQIRILKNTVQKMPAFTTVA